MWWPILSAFILILCMLKPTGSAAGAVIAQADCPNQDLSAKFPPVRNQGSTGQCYAFVAADMIGYLQGVAPSDAVSALDVAVTTLKSEPEDLQFSSDHATNLNTMKEVSTSMLPAIKYSAQDKYTKPVVELIEDGGGFAPMAVLAYEQRSGGLCLEKNLRSEGSPIDQEAHYYINDRFRTALGERNEGDYLYFIPERGGLRIETSLTKVRSGTKELCQVKAGNLESIMSLTKKTNDAAFEKVTQDFNKACGERRAMKPMKFSTQYFQRGNHSKMAEGVALMLKAGQPVAISYDPSFLTDGRETPHLPTSHASIIVGSRWNSETKTCQFKIRNSWGQDCGIYAQEFRKDCQQGNIWVSSQDLNQRVGRLDVFRLK